MRAGLLLAILAGLGLAGVIYDVAALRAVVGSLHVDSVEVTGLHVGHGRMSLYLVLRMHNPTGYTVPIEGLTYSVYVQGTLVARGASSHLVIHGGENSVALPIDVRLAGIEPALQWLLRALVKGGAIDVEVRGVVEALVRWFGLVRLFTVSIPYHVESSLPLAGR